MVIKVPVVPSMSLLTQKHFENVKEQLISYIMKYLQTSLGIGGASQKDPFHQIEISTENCLANGQCNQNDNEICASGFWSRWSSKC